MSNFDLAIGFSTDTLNKCSTGLFAQQAARNKYFKGSKQGVMPGAGNVTFNYEILAAPVFVLSAPTAAAWEAAIKNDGITAMPDGNVFQVQVANMRGSALVEPSTVPTEATGPMVIYCSVTLVNGALKLSPLAVSLDETQFSVFDSWLVTTLLAPCALTMADSMLSAYQLPKLPAYEGVIVNTPVLLVTQNMLIAAATISVNGSAVDTSGYSWPQKGCFALLSPLLINTVLKTNLAPYQGYRNTGSESTGGPAAWAKGDYAVVFRSVTARTQADPTKIDISVDPDISVSGSFGGVLPAMACPVGTALSAL
jgi:hypothetical protein